VRAAASSTLIDNASTTLKVFAAPEFFFRGAIGAYNMATEVRAPRLQWHRTAPCFLFRP
jgi:hypothetical protein